MGFSELFLFVYIIQALGSPGIKILIHRFKVTLRIDLTAAAYTTAGTGHNFNKVIFTFSFFYFRQKLVNVRKAVNYRYAHLCSGNINYRFFNSG